ncbi:MAG: PspC domain-containing protein [Acidimicrobiia bacterium]|nr:PspC domain-containing protein [Acidimicrobiia bacterium]
MESTQLPPQQQEPRPRLERLRQDRAVAGVASGLARYLNVDVAWVRIAFVAAALFGGTGILLYVIGWIAMPEEGERDSIVADKTRNYQNFGSWIGVGLIVLAVMIVIGNTGLIDTDLVFAGVLVVIGFLLWRGDLGVFQPSSNQDDEPESAGTTTTAEFVGDAPADVATADPSFGYEPDYAPIAPTPPPQPPPPPEPATPPRPPRPRESSALGRIAVAAVLITVGIMGVGQSTGWWDPTVRHYVGSVFLILGIALVIGSIFGRARWLIVVGMISAPLLFGAALLDVPLDGGFGDPRFTPTTLSDLEPEYRLIGGEMVFDFTDLELDPGDDFALEASVVFGSLRFEIPPDLGVTVNAEMDAGEIRVNGSAVASGINNERIISYAGVGEIVIDAHVGFGELVVDLVEETE